MATAYRTSPRLAAMLRLQWPFWLIFMLIGCQQPRRDFLQPPPDAPTWPPPPAPARIRYLGVLHSVEDLQPREGFFTRLGNLIVGKKKTVPLYGPRALVTTRDGTKLWVADIGGRCLHVFDLAHRTHRRMTSIGSQPLLSPVSVSRGPNDSLYVCDSEAVAVYHLSADGTLLDALRLPDELLRPVDLAYDPTRKILYVVDAAAHDIKVLDPHGRLVRIIGGRGTAPGRFNFPCDITLWDDQLWVADAGNHRVQCLTPDGRPVIAFGHAGDAPGDLALPKGVALDPDGHVYVVDARFENVQIFDQEGTLLLYFGDEGTGAGEFWLPGGIFIDEEARIWICDTYNRRIQVFAYERVRSEETDTTDDRKMH